MDANRKFQEIEDNKPVESYYGLSDSQLLAAKIQYQIKNYTYRKLSAQEEISDLTRCIQYEQLEWSDVSVMRKRIEVLKDEIMFCHSQIMAYKNNDNKAKIIPDRCL